MGAGLPNCRPNGPHPNRVCVGVAAPRARRRQRRSTKTLYRPGGRPTQRSSRTESRASCAMRSTVVSSAPPTPMAPMAPVGRHDRHAAGNRQKAGINQMGRRHLRDDRGKRTETRWRTAWTRCEGRVPTRSTGRRRRKVSARRRSACRRWPTTRPASRASSRRCTAPTSPLSRSPRSWPPAAPRTTSPSTASRRVSSGRLRLPRLRRRRVHHRADHRRGRRKHAPLRVPGRTALSRWPIGARRGGGAFSRARSRGTSGRGPFRGRPPGRWVRRHPCGHGTACH